MNNNYFRITAYHKQLNVAVIFDSNGCFEKVWQFSSYLVNKGFSIIAVGDETKFTDGNIARAKPDTEHIIMRSCLQGQPILNGTKITVNGKTYTAR